jgi:sugar/nucleoside kinase (ribokinase family)
VRLAVVTRGSRGASAAHGRDVRVAAPAFEVEPVDAVGAGDAFVGALTVRLTEIRCENRRMDGLDRVELLDALSWACAAGALATTRHGAIPSIPARAEIRSLLARSA